MRKEVPEEKIYAFWLCMLKLSGIKKRKDLLSYFHTAENIYHAKRCLLEQAAGLSSKEMEQFLRKKEFAEIKNDYETMKEKGIHFTFRGDAMYPKRLEHLPDAPYGLFYRGKLPDDSVPSVAVVGARKASAAGRELAEKFGYELAANGVQVISGMALGVDISAQRGAMKMPIGRTFAVLGTGVDICYPAGHIESYMEMQKRGGVISEFPLKTPALPYHFPIRNRLISGFSDGILLIEAGRGSGSLITAEFGLEQGREIFVVPGGLFNPLYEGGNELLKSGAAIVTEVKDILDGLGIYLRQDVTEQKKKTNVMLETTEKMVYAILGLEPVSVCELMEMTGFELKVLMEVLISLQAKKLIKSVGNNHFMIRI